MEEQDKNSNENSNERRMGPDDPMEPLGEILSRLPGGRAGKSGEAAQTPPLMEKRPAECECKACGKTFPGETTLFLRYKPPQEVKTQECPECRAKREAEEERQRQEKLAAERKETVEYWRRTCGMTPDLLTKTFDNFDRSWQRHALQDAIAWAQGFSLKSPRGYPSLIFYSPTPGLGKTHLMVAIANYIFDNWEGAGGHRRSPIIFTKGPGLVRRIRATYNLREGDNTHEREEDIYREVAGVPLLLLDDVGKETPSKFTRELYWYIIDERVTSGLPVIITSRLPLQGDNSLEDLMGEDTVDRLYGMTRGEITEMTGRSYRREKEIP